MRKLKKFYIRHTKKINYYSFFSIAFFAGYLDLSNGLTLIGAYLLMLLFFRQK